MRSHWFNLANLKQTRFKRRPNRTRDKRLQTVWLIARFITHIHKLVFEVDAHLNDLVLGSSHQGRDAAKWRKRFATAIELRNLRTLGLGKWAMQERVDRQKLNR